MLPWPTWMQSQESTNLALLLYRGWPLQSNWSVPCCSRPGTDPGHCSLQISSPLGANETALSGHGSCGSAQGLDRHQSQAVYGLRHVHPQQVLTVCAVTTDMQTWHMWVQSQATPGSSLSSVPSCVWTQSCSCSTGPCSECCHK